MQLKTYQQATLDTLRRFFEAAQAHGPKAAYEAITTEPDQARRLRGYGGRYTPLLGQEGMPYVCLRLPTGGGKTLLAAHSVAVARDAWIGRDYPPVLWLVPTTTIRRQTVDALNNPRHHYRKALAAAFGEPVRVFDIADFTRLTAADLSRHLCVFVATIQTLRVENTEGRKVYAHHEALEPLFANVPKRISGLEPLGAEVAKRVGGHPDDIRYSLANLLHLHRPLMIMDEAHKAVTGLSREMQARVNPSAIIEFTATPHPKSNILHAVSAAELKAEQMIKLPVRLDEHQTWEGAVTGAIARRAELAEKAGRDRDGYIRPLVLFQAEDKGREVTVDVLLEHLRSVHHIPADKIAVATGDQRGLDGIDLFSPDCPIDYIITVEALKEGWDCSFAYVFCSVANIRSATDAEQLLGRVLRMPYARRRKAPALNKAYAHLVSKSFAEAATALKDRLVDMGFEEQEAEASIEAAPTLGEGLFGARARPLPSARIEVAADAGTLAAVRAAAPDRLSVEDGAIRITGFLREAEKAAVYAALPAPAAAHVREQVAAYEAEHAHEAAPAELGQTFVVPRLMAQMQGELVFADTDRLSEYFDWSLAEAGHQLTRDQFDVAETADAFQIDLDGDRLTVAHSDVSDQLLLDVPVEGWTESGLVALLAKAVRQDDVRPAELLAWLADVVGFLVRDRHLPLAALMRCRFMLARRLRDRIAAVRQAARERAYQSCLFGPDAAPTVSVEHGFRFADGMFDGVPAYRGSYRFTKHFLPAVPVFDSGEDGEELSAAKQLDAVPEVDVWVRNVASHPAAFWLPLATGRTYPDFVARLTDGRLLVVEYKGGHLVRDAAEKRLAGELWERSGGGLYVFAERERDGMNVRDQIRRAIGRG
ncbi:DEAD/DEAH box helicase family protein [Sphingomonas sp. CCH9-F2]|uniref:DEAD/DEAH box helicase family protein n=1 Tax=Sphingomonas sp. CCH9-F2 TaxID=1768778 RepID=UPI00082F6B40|nr:DEAD/DEAH box helicase family protein [Sphingomonas sp. CCH9-F2]